MNSKEMIWNGVTLERISEEIGCSANTVRVYLARPEFSHIQRMHKAHRAVINNITDSDISRLKELYETAVSRGKSRGK